MRLLNRVINLASTTLALTTGTVMGTAADVTAQNLPLRSSTYFAGGGGYVQIAVQGERICYRGFSGRGSVVASLTPDPENSGFYKINGLEDLVFAQQDNRTILMGPISQLDRYKADNRSPSPTNTILQQCLDSNQPFYRRTDGTRGSG